MKRRIITFLIVLLTAHAYIHGQDIIWTKKLPDNDGFSFLEQSFQVVNEANDDVALFLMNKQHIFGFLFDNKFNIKDSLTSESLRSRYKTLIGSALKENNDYYLYLADRTKRKFGVVNFSFGTGEFMIKELDLKLKDEKFVQTFDVNNQLIVLTITKNSSELNFYYFDGFGFTRKKLDLSGTHFLNGMGRKTNLYSMLTSSGGISNSVSIKKISNKTPNPIEITSANTKVYQEEEEIVITFDEYNDFTQILTLDLLSLSYDLRAFYKPLNDVISSKRKKTNTFKLHDKLFAFTTTSDEMVFTVNDFEEESLIKEYAVKEEDSIYFKNTPIIQDGGIYDAHREMEKTKKFLRKTTSSNIGISVYKKGKYYHITLGGKRQIATGAGFGMAGAMMPMSFGGNFGAINSFYNPVGFAFYSYGTQSTYINCLFDDTFQHIKGDMEKNVFDNIKEYKEEHKNSTKAETLFQHGDYFVFGAYSVKDDKYVLRKFQD